MSNAASVSSAASCSGVAKKTREPSSDFPRKMTPKAPLPLICPAEILFVVPLERS
jgi:hypothetical protein